MKLTKLIALAAASSSVVVVAAASPAGRPFGVTLVPTRRTIISERSDHHGESTPSCINRDVLSIRGGAVHESSTLDDLESKIQNAALQNKLTVVDFTATWCGPCKMIGPIFTGLSDEYGDRAQFIKVDVDVNPAAAQKYGVSAMPTFLFVKGGEVVDTLMGANSERLKEKIAEWSF